MHSCFFETVDLHICLQTPRALPATRRLMPFLTDPCVPDCTVTVEQSSVLPQPSARAVRSGAVAYEGIFRMFHYTSPAGPLAAVTTLDDGGNIQLQYLPEYACWFDGFSGIFNRIGMELLLLRHEKLMLHASVVRHREGAILFTGPSGIGKSTQAELWHRVFGAEILNGDRAGLGKRDGLWHAYGMPYAGSSGIYRNCGAPVRAIVVLGQAKENRIRKLSAAEAFSRIYPELSVHRWNRDFVEPATRLLLEIIENADVYSLECLPEESAVRLLEEVLL